MTYHIPRPIIDKFVSFLYEKKVFECKDDAVLYVDIETDDIIFDPTDECLVYLMRHIIIQHKEVLDNNKISLSHSKGYYEFETENNIAYRLALNIAPHCLSTRLSVTIDGELIQKPQYTFIVYFPGEDHITVHVYKNKIHKFYERFIRHK